MLLGVIAVALVVPALSLAGGSAGNQQYTDPFGSGSGSTTTHAAAPSTTASPPPATTPETTAATVAATTTAADPTATAATTSSGTLPHTGYDLWTGVGFGVTLIAAGIVLRRRTHHA